jgi:hypothetical protein
MRTKTLLMALFLVLAVSSASMAQFIPYPNIGTPAAPTSFIATGTGPVEAYFYGQTAGFDSVIGLWVNGVNTGIYGLPNHASPYGASLNFGNVNSGDTLEFELYVYNLGYSWFSTASDNSDGLNHTYSTAFAGDSFIPAGTYVGFEDLPGGGDLDYDDHQFVFTNVSSVVPEPASLALLGSGLLGAGLVAARRRKVKTV